MWIVLRKSAFSPNIKERRDYSCAECTAQGEVLEQDFPVLITRYGLRDGVGGGWN